MLFSLLWFMRTCTSYYVIFCLIFNGFYSSYMFLICMVLWCDLAMALIHDLISYWMIDECMGWQVLLQLAWESIDPSRWFSYED